MEAQFKNKISPNEISKTNREKSFQVFSGHDSELHYIDF